MQFRRSFNLGVEHGSLKVLIYGNGVASERAENVAEALRMSMLTQTAQALLPDIDKAVRTQLIKILPNTRTRNSNAVFTHTIAVGDFSTVDLDITLRVNCSSISEELQLLIDKFAESLKLDTIVEETDRRTGYINSTSHGTKMATSPQRVRELAH